MNPEACSMAQLVEAKWDGRLGDRDLGSINRHLATCAACSQLAETLERVRALLRTPAPAPSPLEVQRRRLKLLREAAFPPPSRQIRRPAPTQVLALVAAAALVFLILDGRLARSVTSVAATPSATTGPFDRTVTTITPVGEARFQRTSEGETEVVTLSDGAVSFSVRHLQPGERYLVRTADAEVEVRGTVFRVEATNGSIRNVAVLEGKVDVRFGGAMFTLAADERWDRQASASPARVPTVATVAPESPKALLPLAKPVAGKGRVTEPRPATSTRAAAEDDAPAFVDGMGMMERGDYGAAAGRLEAFAKSSPNDDRAEDAAFLVILALQRAGRASEAVEAARRYLGAYPSGYRRRQAQVIADAP